MRNFIFFLLLLFLGSCQGEDTSILTCRLSRTDFIEKICVPGKVQAVSNIPVLAPRTFFGSMTVDRITPDGRFVKKGDTLCILSNPNLSTTHESTSLQLENAEAELQKLIADNAMNLSTIHAQLENANARMMISSLDSVQMRFAPPVQKRILELEIKKAMIEKQKLEKKIKAQKIIDDSEIRQSKARIMQQQMQLQTMKDQLNSLIIISQRDGFVMAAESPLLRFLSPSGSGSIGGKIQAGSNLFSNMPILQFPDLSRMQISAEVGETDYKRIEKGQKVSISIDAIKDLRTTGPVNRKSLVGRSMQVPSPDQTQSKVKSYEVIIDLDSCHSKMKPGLSASCEIMISEIRDTIVVPTLAVFERDSMKVVYVADGKKYIRVPIEPGRSNSSHTLVIKGLSGNEVIALSEPPHNMIIQNAQSDKNLISGVK